MNSLSHFIFMQPPVFQLAFFGVVDLAIGVFALVKKNVPVLMVGVFNGACENFLERDANYSHRWMELLYAFHHAYPFPFKCDDCD